MLTQAQQCTSIMQTENLWNLVGNPEWGTQRSLCNGEQWTDPVLNHAEGDPWSLWFSTDIHTWAMACECNTPVLTHMKMQTEHDKCTNPKIFF